MCCAIPSRKRGWANLYGVAGSQRPEALREADRGAARDARARTGRPHWIVVDEAQSTLLPAAWQGDGTPLPRRHAG